MTNPAQNQAAPVSLPQGGGAVQGLGETFRSEPFTGSGVLTLPITLSPGRDGFSPTLELQYSSGNGNGPFGIGWAISLPRVTRKTEKGLPRYDADDVFLLSGAEDLVPEASLNPAPTGDQLPLPFVIARYRPRTEGLFARIEKWVETATGDTHWRATTRDNITSVYGRSPAARLADPNHTERVYEWMLEETFDSKGNHILYEYARDDDSLSRTTLSERNRCYGQRYLRRIFYGNHNQSAGPERNGVDQDNPFGTRPRRYLFEIAFDYGDSPDPPPPVSSAQELTIGWPLRPDPFSTFRGGFEARTLRRCARTAMYHHFPELGGRTLIRATDFIYDTDTDTGMSLLKQATVTGYSAEGGVPNQSSLPPVAFIYSQFRPHEQRYRPLQARDDDLPPFALNQPDVTLVDLFGDGLPDILYAGSNGFRYWKNLGDACFDSPRFLPNIPAGLSLSQPGVSLSDMDGDGRVELLIHSGPVQGFFSATPDGAWESFRRYPTAPAFELSDPNIRLVDLTGDGLNDALMTRDQYFLWFKNCGAAGFAQPQAIEREHDLDGFPDVYFNDPSGRLRLADMSGDGLTDIVLLHNGRVDYWPNLGYGRFGKRLTMMTIDQAPGMDANFDPHRLFLTDLNGTGCADLVYIDFDRIHFWFNQSGNRWSERQTLCGTPPVTDPGMVQFADIFGTGMATLVWSDNYGVRPGSNYKALDFCGGVKPYLLVERDNNLGTTTRIRYAPSTKFALADRRMGQPWATQLPMPVQVVEKVESIDHLSKTKLVSRYRYHHGYYDGREREFRGFGRVDRLDTESFERFQQSDLHADTIEFENGSAAHFVPPVLTRTWYHTGADFAEGRTLQERYHEEFYACDTNAFPASDHDIDSGDAPHAEAVRALRGSVLRTEVYALDDGPPAETDLYLTTLYATDDRLQALYNVRKWPHPYLVTESSYRVRPLQPKGSNLHAVLLLSPQEAISYHYERNPDDPRITQQITATTDAFGNVIEGLTVAYPRRAAGALPEQQRLRVLYDWRRFINTPEDASSGHDDPAHPADYFRYVGVPCETRRFEIVGAASLWTAPRRLTRADFASLLAAPDTFAPPEQTPSGFAKRLLRWSRMYYRTDAETDIPDATDRFDHRLEFGRIGRLGLPFETYQAAFSAGLLQDLYQGEIADTDLDSGGYVPADRLDATPNAWPANTDHVWWLPGGRQAFETASTGGFYQPVRSQDPFGSVSTRTYDPYRLFVKHAEDALANTTDVTRYDYRVLQPAEITDPNGNRSEATFDALGLVTRTALLGKGEGEPPLAPEADMDGPTTIARLLADAPNQATLLLGKATTRFLYDLHRFQREGKPPVVCTLARETHDAALPTGETSRTQCSFLYFDGFGRAMQTKVPAEPERHPDGAYGPPRWVGTGWTIYNNKGKPVQQYEPFFTNSPDFESDVRNGVASTLFYDPLERVVCTLRPDDAYTKVVFTPWQQATWDPNDTVLLRPQDDPDVKGYVGEYIRSLPNFNTWYEQRTPAPGTSPIDAAQDAARKTAEHANTPTVAHLDEQGRLFLTIADNRTELLKTTVTLDIVGNDLVVTDPRDVTAFTHGFDMLGRKLRIDSRDAGLRRMLLDVMGNSLLVLDANGNRVATAYDVLRRPTEITVTLPGQAPFVATRTEYGEPLGAAAMLNNHRARVYRVSDGAGVVTHEAFDFKGNLLSVARQVTQDYADVPAWNAAPTLETNRTYRVASLYDALNRVIGNTLQPNGDPPWTPGGTTTPPWVTPAPDNAVYRTTYNEASLLQTVHVRLPGQTAETVFVSDVEYNEKAQRKRIVYGNGVKTCSTYEQDTFRLQSLVSRKADGTLFQSLTYAYDPVGNITHVRDDAFDSIFHAGQQIDPVSDYTYDAVYRLIRATGREHDAMSDCQYRNFGGRGGPCEFPAAQPINNGQALHNYTETFLYDLAGNLRQTQHIAGSLASWTRSQTYQGQAGTPFSNRLISSDAGCLAENGSSEDATAYQHDANGNLIAMPHLPQVTWDYANRLISAQTTIWTSGSPDCAFYNYDAAGMRVRKIIERGNARSCERIYLGGFEIYREYRSANVSFERQTFHVMDDKQRIALAEHRVQDDNGREAGEPIDRIRYQLNNHLDSSCLELDENAAWISYEEYRPYGGTAFLTGPNVAEVRRKRYRYSGKERDDETGLYYYGARYYAPWLGRWTSCDPAGTVDGLNVYAYSRLNPIVMLDLTGKEGVNWAEASAVCKESDPPNLPNPPKVDTAADVSLALRNLNNAGVPTDSIGVPKSATAVSPSPAGWEGNTLKNIIATYVHKTEESNRQNNASNLRLTDPLVDPLHLGNSPNSTDDFGKAASVAAGAAGDVGKETKLFKEISNWLGDNKQPLVTAALPTVLPTAGFVLLNTGPKDPANAATLTLANAGLDAVPPIAIGPLKVKVGSLTLNNEAAGAGVRVSGSHDFAQQANLELAIKLNGRFDYRTPQHDTLTPGVEGQLKLGTLTFGLKAQTELPKNDFTTSMSVGYKF